MSKASKVINIFIFVFAIVVVVFGVLLFQKREQITQARSDIADTVEKVSPPPENRSSGKNRPILR